MESHGPAIQPHEYDTIYHRSSFEALPPLHPNFLILYLSLQGRTAKETTTRRSGRHTSEIGEKEEKTGKGDSAASESYGQTETGRGVVIGFSYVKANRVSKIRVIY